MRKKIEEKIKAEPKADSKSAPIEDIVCSTETRKRCCGGLLGKTIVLAVVILIAVAGYYAWSIYQGQLDPQVQAEKAEKAAEKEILAIVAKVQNLMVLPDDELPQIAEIKDAALAAQEQPFLSGSENGDILLVYANAGKAIVYSPSRNIIVNVGPVQMGAPEPTEQSADISETPDSTDEEE